MHFAIGALTAAKVDEVATRYGLQDRVLGATKGAQCLDIAQPLSLAMELTNYCRSGFAIAAADVKGYYDNINLLLIVLQLMAWRLSPALAQTLHRLHMCPKVRLVLSKTTRHVGMRANGVLTGSRKEAPSR